MNTVILKSYLKKIISPSIQAKIKKILAKESMDEGEIIYQLLKSKNKSKVMIDVGAHHGGSLDRFARDGWKIYAFEPDPKNRAVLESRFKGRRNVRVDSRAVSNKNEKELVLFTSSVSSGISSLCSFHHTHKETLKVDTITLHFFCEAVEIQMIDYLKIDTEGYDLFVLYGVPWENIEPEVILCEFEDKKTTCLGYNFHNLADFLVDKDYQLLISEWYPIVEYGMRHRWRRFTTYPCELMDKDAWGNIIAVKQKDVFSNLLAITAKYKS